MFPKLPNLSPLVEYLGAAGSDAAELRRLLWSSKSKAAADKDERDSVSRDEGEGGASSTRKAVPECGGLRHDEVECRG